MVDSYTGCVNLINSVVVIEKTRKACEFGNEIVTNFNDSRKGQLTNDGNQL